MTVGRLSGGHGVDRRFMRISGLWVYVLAGPPVGAALTLWLLGAGPVTRR